MHAPFQRFDRLTLLSLATVSVLAVAMLSACGHQEPNHLAAPAPAPANTVFEVMPLPHRHEAANPDLVLAPSGRLLLSWVEPREEGGHRLMLAQSQGPSDAEIEWQVAPIAEGDNWFVNWADTPHVWALPDGSLWAHWLRRTGPGRMDYGIDLVRSEDGGAQWTAPRLVNLPGVLSDHGFVSFWVQADDQLGIAWLDSRQKGISADDDHSDHHAHHGGGPMMLRAATFGPDAAPITEWPLDTSTCDCCPTSSAVTSRGAVVVYRGRAAGEIRDMRLVRLEDGAWTPSRAVHDDGWKIAGCPVNGPAVEAAGEDVWVAWYTEGGGQPSVRVARSMDAGDHFDAPVELSAGPAVLGRVAMALHGDEVLVAWLEEGGEGQQLMLARMRRDLHGMRKEVVASLDAKGRASGMPRLVANGVHAWMVWVDVEGARPGLRGMRLD